MAQRILVVILCFGLSSYGFALDGESTKPAVIPPLEKVEKPAPASPADGPTSPSKVLPGERPIRKNYWLPALEIPSFIALWNRIDRTVFTVPDYDSTWASGWDHVIHGHWVVDNDAFSINQFGHPYQGTIYYGLARSSGLNFWESLLYSNAGSLMWETYGEITNPSINDQVASGTAGAIFGEPLFRMSSLVLEGGDDPTPGFWRELGAGLLSPPAELNRVIFGHDYGPLLEHRNPSTLVMARLGAGQNMTVRAPESNSVLARDVGEANFSIGYGLPGKSGYKYLRPFDYFHLEGDVLAEKKSSFENLMIRGLLFGKPYESGDALRGVWGLYGTYDYLSPQVFRVSTTAAQLGTTFQEWLTQSIALQGTGLLGAGYGAAGTILPTAAEGDFHYGLTPQGLLALRLIFGSRFMLDTTARGYYVTSLGSSRAPGTEQISRVDSSFVMRLWGPHSLGIHYLMTSRQARYSTDLPDRHQWVETVLLAYNYVSDFNFGAVSWGR